MRKNISGEGSLNLSSAILPAFSPTISSLAGPQSTLFPLSEQVGEGQAQGFTPGSFCSLGHNASRLGSFSFHLGFIRLRFLYRVYAAAYLISKLVSFASYFGQSLSGPGTTTDRTCGAAGAIAECEANGYFARGTIQADFASQTAPVIERLAPILRFKPLKMLLRQCSFPGHIPPQIPYSSLNTV